MEILARRSTDGGRVWEEATVVVAEEKMTCWQRDAEPRRPEHAARLNLVAVLPETAGGRTRAADLPGEGAADCVADAK